MDGWNLVAIGHGRTSEPSRWRVSCATGSTERDSFSCNFGRTRRINFFYLSSSRTGRITILFYFPSESDGWIIIYSLINWRDGVQLGVQLGQLTEKTEREGDLEKVLAACTGRLMYPLGRYDSISRGRDAYARRGACTPRVKDRLDAAYAISRFMLGPFRACPFSSISICTVKRPSPVLSQKC